MTNEIFIPPDDYAPSDKPLIFLAGPIQGCRDWQKDAIEILQRLAPSVNIANPRREYMGGTFVYSAQVDWETHHLRMAGENGVILFWLECEEKHDPHRAFAQTSRFEIGECKVRHERDGARLVIGIDEGFSGAKYIRHRFGQDCPKVPIVSSLEDACKAAVAELQRPK